MYVHVYLCTFVTVWTCVEANHAALLYIFTFVMLFLLVVYSKVRVEGDGVFVKAETAKLAQFRQTMDMGKAQSADDNRTFLIIGGGTCVCTHSQSQPNYSCYGTQLSPPFKHGLAVISLASHLTETFCTFVK